MFTIIHNRAKIHNIQSVSITNDVQSTLSFNCFCTEPIIVYVHSQFRHKKKHIFLSWDCSVDQAGNRNASGIFNQPGRKKHIFLSWDCSNFFNKSDLEPWYKSMPHLLKLCGNPNSSWLKTSFDGCFLRRLCALRRLCVLFGKDL